MEYDDGWLEDETVTGGTHSRVSDSVLGESPIFREAAHAGEPFTANDHVA
jgi:hypothetical protein